MTFQNYISKLNRNSQIIFKESILNIDNYSETYNFIYCLSEFSDLISDENEQMILKNVCPQLEMGLYCCSIGLYRQAFASLRLGFEIGMSTVYFSLNKLEYFEWIKGKNDIRWSTLTDVENGLFSKRVNSLFNNFDENVLNEYSIKAKSIYRDMSEHVHGNYTTWATIAEVKYSSDSESTYLIAFKNVFDTLAFVLSCRYLRELDIFQKEKIELINERLGHIENIRKQFNISK